MRRRKMDLAPATLAGIERRLTRNLKALNPLRIDKIDSGNSRPSLRRSARQAA
jgi:hypothetical protein